jgi:hypothetical protein
MVYQAAQEQAGISHRNPTFVSEDHLLVAYGGEHPHSGG